MARYSEEHIQTLRTRMRHDVMTTFRNFNIDHVTTRMSRTSFDLLVDAIVEDGMHPIEKMIARENFYGSVQGRQ
jgi:hypothetical protein